MYVTMYRHITRPKNLCRHHVTQEPEDRKPQYDAVSLERVLVESAAKASLDVQTVNSRAIQTNN
jgi:hypothetical protein